MRHWRPKNRKFHIPENRRQRLLDSVKDKRKPFSRMRLTIWLIELVALLAVIELFLLPSCQSPDTSAPALRPPRPAPSPKPAPEIELGVRLPESLKPAGKPLLPPTELLAPGSRTAQEKQVRHAQRNGLPLEIVNSLGIRFRLIPPGTYVMGSPPSEPGRWKHETEHVVSISRAFYMSVTEITQQQWSALMPTRPFWFKGAKLPAEELTWYDGVRFANALCDHEDVPHAVYRMPTEEEWEYACRAGTTTTYYFGESDEYLHEFAEYRENNNNAPVAVPSRRPNAWGLHNMLGNVQEWCLNKFRMYETDEPLSAERKDFRALRGGHWRSPADQCRAAERGLLYPSSHGNLIGVRLIREAVDFKAREKPPAPPPADSSDDAGGSDK